MKEKQLEELKLLPVYTLSYYFFPIFNEHRPVPFEVTVVSLFRDGRVLEPFPGPPPLKRIPLVVEIM